MLAPRRPPRRGQDDGKVQEWFNWLGMQQDVAQWIHTCPVCATRKSPTQRNCAPLKTMVSGFPMQVVAVDILGPYLVSSVGNSYSGVHLGSW